MQNLRRGQAPYLHVRQKIKMKVQTKNLIKVERASKAKEVRIINNPKSYKFRE